MFLKAMFLKVQQAVGKTLMVLASYALSSIGISLSFITTFKELSNFQWSLTDFIAIATVLAWIIHIIMCVTWIADKRVGILLPVLGTIFALFAIFALPIIDFILFDPLAIEGFFAAFFMMGFVLPCIFLAIYLVCYHAGKL